MGEDQKLTRLIAGIYDAALDSTQWSGVLGGIADFVDGQSGGLLAKDTLKKSVHAHCHANVDPHFMQLYADTYGKCGPVAISLFGEVDCVASIPELMPYDEFCRGCFYREWAKPQGWVDVAIAVIEKSSTGCAYLSVARDASSGMVDEEMRRRLSLVVPHVRRAVQIGKAVDFKQAEAATFADILDNLSAGLFLIDADARIVHANAAADELLGTVDFVRSVGGRLVAADVQVDQTLRDTAMAAANGDLGIATRGVGLPVVANDGTRYVAHILPLSSGERRSIGFAYAATAAVFICRTALGAGCPPEAIGKVYKLTPAELRVLLAIVEIGGVPEVADALGVADTTVKTHLRRLFEKTGTGRQADLVKLVAGFSTPLVN